MSDSELSIRSRSPSPVPKKKTPKDKNKSAAHSPWYESDRVTPQPQATASKRKAADGTTSEPAGLSKRKKTTANASKKSGLDLFQIIKEEESCAPTSSKSTSTTSSFASRVASGTSRRTVVRSGDYFIDLKVYKVEDVQKETDALERYKKALVAIRLQCEERSVEWVQLQSFLGIAFGVFKDSDPTYYNNSRK